MLMARPESNVSLPDRVTVGVGGFSVIVAVGVSIGVGTNLTSVDVDAGGLLALAVHAHNSMIATHQTDLCVIGMLIIVDSLCFGLVASQVLPGCGG